MWTRCWRRSKLLADVRHGCGDTIFDAACAVLNCSCPNQKAVLSAQAAAAFAAGDLSERGDSRPTPPDRPARPEAPVLLAPNKMPKRSAKGPQGRAALLHAIAHIELNAIDLSWDMIARFTAEVDDVCGMANGFVRDWLKVAEEEAKHFNFLTQRLAVYGGAYGALPAHDGLWDAAFATRNDLVGRLSVVPMVLEARGLDVTPAMIERFADAGDSDSADVLRVILEEEIGHVQIGTNWQAALCLKMGLDPKAAFQSALTRYFRGQIKRPLNEDARQRAGFPLDFVEGL